MTSCFQRQSASWYVCRVVLFYLGFACVGCTSPAFRRNKTTVERNPAAGTSAQLIDDLARPYGMNSIRVEGVSLVRGLNGTGGDPPPSAEREMLLEEMRIHEVDQPNHVLASKNTALVTVQAVLPPGIQKGDPIDVEVRAPRRQNVTSLQGGWLMPTRLREYARVKNRIAEGHLRGFAKGDVLVDAMFTSSDDAVTHNRGRVLGGGIASKTRNLGLTVRDEHLSVATSARIGEAINRRFHIYDRGLQRPVANPKRDRFIELLVHPRYQDNVIRYMRVVQSIPVRFGPGGIAERLRTLETELMNPTQSAATALKLEALGEDGIPVLRAGLRHGDKEVRFYSSEALAYLDDAQAVTGLVDAIQNEPAFRKRCFIALGAMDDPQAHEALIDLMRHESAETRYAAFRTLRRIMPDDPHVNGERLGSFYMHVVETAGSSLVHVLRSERPEIVLFGSDHPVQMPLLVYAGEQIVVKGDLSDEVSVTKIVAGQEDQTIKCPPQLEPIIRSIVDLGGTYPDVVQAIAQAKNNKLLVSRLEFDALPTANRTYERDEAPLEQAGRSGDTPKKKSLSQRFLPTGNPLRSATAFTPGKGLASKARLTNSSPNTVAKPVVGASNLGASNMGAKNLVAGSVPADSGPAESSSAKVQLLDAKRAPNQSVLAVSHEDTSTKSKRPVSSSTILFASETCDEPPLPAGNPGMPEGLVIDANNLEAVESGVEVAFADDDVLAVDDDLPPVIDKFSQQAPIVASTRLLSRGLAGRVNATSSGVLASGGLAPEPKPIVPAHRGVRKSVASTHSLTTVSDTIEFGQ